jgi:mannose-6-phosphate isomerase-like protein (cupin superfamily)/rhodanese-related sulfurtransferase
MADTISRDDLRAALDAGTVTAVDGRPPAAFGEQHLPDAVSVIAGDDEARIADALPDRAAPLAVYGDDAVAERLEALGYRDVRVYAGGVEDWVAAGLPVDVPRAADLDLADIRFSPTAWLFEGHRRAGVDIAIFVTRTPPGRAVPLHVHPYAETFLLLEGTGRWTRGEEAVELAPEQLLVVPPDTPHGFRNTGDVPLLVVSVHERGTVRQTWLGQDPA